MSQNILENILDNLRKPDLDLPETYKYFSIKLWIDEGIEQCGGEYKLLTNNKVNSLLNSLINDEHYPHRQKVLDVITDKELLR